MRRFQKTILAIDGGGIFGVLAAMILARLEELTERPLGSLVDLIAGTSTGAILACGLAKPLSAESLFRLYLDEGATIFPPKTWFPYSRWFWSHRHDAAGLEAVLRQWLGADTPMGWATTNLMVSAFDTQAGRPVFYKSWKGEIAMWEAARKSSAAPSYFHRHGPHTDGGLVANNPGMAALSEAYRLWPGVDPAKIMVVSVGCGGAWSPVPPAKREGLKFWARHLPAVVGEAQLDAVDYYLRHQPCDYRRFQPTLTRSGGLDDASREHLASLVAAGEAYLEEHAGELEALARELTG